MKGQLINARFDDCPGEQGFVGSAVLIRSDGLERHALPGSDDVQIDDDVRAPEFRERYRARV